MIGLRCDSLDEGGDPYHRDHGCSCVLSLHMQSLVGIHDGTSLIGKEVCMKCFRVWLERRDSSWWNGLCTLQLLYVSYCLGPVQTASSGRIHVPHESEG